MANWKVNPRCKRVPNVCATRTCYVFSGDICIGSLTEETNDAGEFDWVFEVFWNEWEKAGRPGVDGYDLSLHLPEYIRNYVPYIVDQRTLPDTRDGLREELDKWGLTWNDRFEYMCRTGGVCGNNDLTIHRTRDN